MTERDFEQFVRAGLREVVDDAAPTALRARVLAIPVAESAIPERGFGGRWRSFRTSRFAPIALAATAVAVALLIGIGLLVRSPDVGPSPIPGPTHSATVEPNQTPGPARNASWTTTGSMADARFDFTATLLADGRVLVAGGDLGYDANPRALASAELFDPSTGTWTPTGSMSTGRYRHTATLLPNGKVLVAGGNVNDSGHLGSACCLATAELYDPATGTWTATGSMMDARVDHTATLLLDGNVLVTGGDSAPVNGIPPGAELYDPATGRWTSTGTMARHDHTATLLTNGNVFVMGGSAPQDSGELYDPGSRTWSETDCCTDDPTRFGPFRTATLLPDGQVLVAGGLAYASHTGQQTGRTIVATPAAALYDPRTGHWTATGDMIAGLEEFTATLLPDGTVLVVGGWLEMDQAFDGAELYDPRTGTWTATTSMAEGRYHHLAVTLFDGTVLVVGGTSGFVDGVGFTSLSSAELYDSGIGS